VQANIGHLVKPWAYLAVHIRKERSGQKLERR
jgi:hypothetical protein